MQMMNTMKLQRIKEIVLFSLLIILSILSVYESFETQPLFVTVGLSVVTMQLLAAVWVYYDAKSRNLQNAIMWYIAVVLPVLGLLVFLFYLSSRGDGTET